MAFVTQLMNSFAQTPILGQVDMVPSPNIVPAQINPASSATVGQVGCVVKLVTGTSGAIVVDYSTGATDTVVPFGVIPYNQRDNNGYLAGTFVEVATNESYVYLLSGGAIAQGASVSFTASTASADPTVVSDSTTGHQCLGFAIDAASGAGVLIRVVVRPFTHA